MENYYCPFDYYDNYYDDYGDYFRRSNVSPEAIESHVGGIVLISLKWHGTITACIDSHNRHTGVVTLTVYTHFGHAQLRIHYSAILRITPIHVMPHHGKMPVHENPSHGVMPSHGAKPNENPNQSGWQGSNKDLK